MWLTAHVIYNVLLCSMNMACNKGITTHAKLKKLFGKEAYSISKDSLWIITNMNKFLLMYVLGIKIKKKKKKIMIGTITSSNGWVKIFYAFTVQLKCHLSKHLTHAYKKWKNLIQKVDLCCYYEQHLVWHISCSGSERKHVTITHNTCMSLVNQKLT
jgi:hypothetical protein